MSVETSAGVDTVRDGIMRAFSGPTSTWRTADGVARQTGLPLPTVLAFFQNHPELFVESPVTLGGIVAFGLRERLTSEDDEL